MNEDVRRRLDESTDRVLGLLGDPDRNGSWDRRGLVVGLVQSGKTSHYIGLVNKAVDAGYKVIVIMTGFTESLRIQTQIRAEEGFLGYWKERGPNPTDQIRHQVGVGLIDPGLDPDSITTRKSDFTTGIAKNFGIHPGGREMIFVVKKNAGILKSLLNWVEMHGNRSDKDGKRFVEAIPLLVIDDESDVGSIDTRKGNIVDDDPDPDHDPSAINGRIRKLLSLFDQSSYVGYTATPFANVLIHQEGKTDDLGEDLFPRSFIVSLPTPSDHVGPSMVFGTDDEAGSSDGLPIVRRIPRDESTGDSAWIPPVHKKECKPSFQGRGDVPPSLREAVLSFILIVASRRIRRDETRHNSMLIHVTRFTDVQDEVTEQVKRELHGVQQRLRHRTADRELLDDLKLLWNDDFIPTTNTIAARPEAIFNNPIHSWNDIQKELIHAVESIDVRAIHGKAGEVLDYETHADGLNVIAIGGNKLSRGLTLEGLSVSYFLRCSRMYDTLMQMGRWFGYRPGYLDLCRLYTTKDLADSFTHIANATEELNELFDIMARSGGDPKNFGLRVRSHPQLMVTSSLKMRNGTKRTVTFEGDQLETILFRRDNETVSRNWQAGEELAHSISEDDNSRTVDLGPNRPNSQVRVGVSPHCIMNFLDRYIGHEDAYKVRPKILKDYVEAEVNKRRLTEWTVVLSGSKDKEKVAIGGLEFRCVQRSWYFTSTRGIRKKDKTEKHKELEEQERQELIDNNTFRIRRLLDPPDEQAGLTPDVLNAALETTVAKWEDEQTDGSRRRRKKPTDPVGWALREARSPKQGLLILYAIDPDDKKAMGSSEADGVPILAFAISFPKVKGGLSSRVTYMVNNVYTRQEHDQTEVPIQ